MHTSSLLIFVTALCVVPRMDAVPVPPEDPTKFLKRHLEASEDSSPQFAWPTGKQPALDAWDCDKPSKIQDFVFDNTLHCNTKPSDFKVSKDRFTLLQDTETVRYKGYKCVLKESRRVQQCGGYDHMAHLNWKSFFNKRVIMDRRACIQAAEDGSFKRHDGALAHVAKRGVTEVNYDSVGGSWADEHGELQCVGEKTIVGRQSIYDAVVHSIHNIEIRDETFVFQNGILRSTSDNFHLPCSVDRGHCETLDGTFIWNSADTLHCPVKRLREFEGTTTSTPSGDVIESNLKDKIRLRKGRRVQKCDKIVYETSLRGIYLDYVSTGYEWSDIDPRDMSVTKYTDAKDEWLFHYIMKIMQSKNDVLRQRECARIVESEAKKHGIRSTDRQGKVWALNTIESPGEFALTAGHTLYTFECKKRTVMPRPTAVCYQELPITMVLEGTHRKAFMDPVFDMIVDHGTPIPCSNRFRPKFRTNDGLWLVASPTITSTLSFSACVNFDLFRTSTRKL